LLPSLPLLAFFALLFLPFPLSSTHPFFPQKEAIFVWEKLVYSDARIGFFVFGVMKTPVVWRKTLCVVRGYLARRAR